MVDKISEEQSVSLTDNTITGCATGILLTETCGETGTQISGNTFEENAVHVQDDRSTASANYLEELLANNTFPEGSQVIGNQIKVFEPEENKVYNKNTGEEYDTIQAAIDAAQEGDTILIAAGTYDLTSTLTINKSITVQGIDKEEVILKGANSITNTIYLGNGATLKNVTVTRDNSGDWATNKNNQLINFYNSNGKTTTLEECIITGGRNGVYVNNKTDIVIKDNLIDNNRTGIQMANRNDATVENNIITNNHTMGVLLLEFESVGTGKPIFTGNEIRDNWYSDFENRWAAEYVVDLTNNTFTDGTYKVADTSGEPGYGDLRPVELGGLATRPEDRTTFIMKTAGNLILPSLD
jgi:nitrous oxidase accessory protein NosD